MSTVYKRDPLGDMPSMTDYLTGQAAKGYEERINEAVKERCLLKDWQYHPDRIRLFTDEYRNRLYYYQTDTGTLEPLIALSPMEVNWEGNGIEEGIRMVMESVELHSNIFKPNI